MVQVIVTKPDGASETFACISDAAIRHGIHARTVQNAAERGMAVNGMRFVVRDSPTNPDKKEVAVTFLVGENAPYTKVYDSMTACINSLHVHKKTILKYARSGEPYKDMRFRLVSDAAQPAAHVATPIARVAAAEPDNFRFVFGDDAGEGFAGKTIRVTKDPVRISVLDALKAVRKVELGKPVWLDMLKTSPRLRDLTTQWSFPGQRDTLVADFARIKTMLDVLPDKDAVGVVLSGLAGYLGIEHVAEDAGAEAIDPFTYVFGSEAGEMFAGKGVRATRDPERISIYDVIKIVCDVEQPKHTWYQLESAHAEVTEKLTRFQFPGQGQRPTPVTNLQGMMEIIQLLPGKRAAVFRSGAAKLLVRYLGGDTTLAGEVQAIADMHDSGATQGTAIGMFREAVQKTAPVPALPLYPANPYALASPRLRRKTMADFDGKKVCYLLIFFHEGLRYIKFGCTNNPRERMAEHISSEVKCYPNAYVYTMVESTDNRALEATFRKRMQEENHLTDLVIGGKKHTEILVNIEPSDAELHLMDAKVACEAQSGAESDVSVQLARLELEKTTKIIELAKLALEKCPEMYAATLALLKP